MVPRVTTSQCYETYDFLKIYPDGDDADEMCVLFLHVDFLFELKCDPAAARHIVASFVWECTRRLTLGNHLNAHLLLLLLFNW